MKNQPFRKMAERTLCSAIFVGIVAVTSTPAAQQRPSSTTRPSLPSPSQLRHIQMRLAAFTPSELATALAEGRASAEHCVVADGVTCTQLLWQTDRFEIAVGRWEYRANQSEWYALHLTDGDGAEVSAERWTTSSDGGVARSFQTGARDAPAMRAQMMTIEPGNSQSQSGAQPHEFTIQLHDIVWHQAAARGDTPELSVMSADYAVFEDQSWRIEDLRLEPLGPRLGEVDAEEPLPRSGFLPPSIVHAGGDVTELEVIAVRASPAIGGAIAGYLRGTFERWYGLGVGIVGQHEPSRRGLSFEDDRALATVGAVWKPGVRPGLAAEGEAVFGRPLNHAAVALETPGYEEAWRTQRLRRGAYFREWSHSRVGAALHGQTHALRLSVFDSRVYGGLDSGRAGGGRVGFGTEQAISDRTQVGLEVEHVTTSFGGQDRHLSSVRSDVMVEFGRSDRAYVRAGGLGRLRSRLVPTDVGFGAGTAGGVYAAVEAGLSFTGRFDDARHLVRPSVFGVSELVDFEKTAAEAISDGGDAPVGTSVAFQDSRPWNTAGIRLEQRFSSGDWRLDLPVETFVATFGPLDSLRDSLGASAGAEASYFGADGTEFIASSHMVCERACQNVAWDFATRLRAGRWTVGYNLARANRLSQRIADLHETRDAWSRILAFDTPASSLRVSQAAHLGWERRRFRLEINGVTDLDGWGASLEPYLAFRELGWSIGLTGFYNDFDGEWGVLAGLRGH